jgi:endonuclease III
MAEPKASAITATLLDRYGRTYADELGIRIAAGTPSALFRLMVASILFSARINASQSVKAARALSDAGWTSAQKLAEASWDERVKVLNEHGYARYDERTASMLGDACAFLLDRYGGDLRRLREAAGRDPRRERTLLKQVKGIGDVCVDIFFREVQVTWDELYPFVDQRAARAARKLGLPDDPHKLASGRDRQTFTRLVTALIRADLAGDKDEVLKAAAGQRTTAGT